MTNELNQPSNSVGAKIEINRPLVAAIGGICLLVGGIWWYVAFDDQMPIWPGVFIRIGMFMSALWMALPTKTRPAAWAKVSPWTFIGLFLVIMMFARNPRMAIAWIRVVVPMLVVVGIITLILRPKPKNRPQHRP